MVTRLTRIASSAIFWRRMITIATVTDGTSNTMAFSEGYDDNYLSFCWNIATPGVASYLASQ